MDKIYIERYVMLGFKQQIKANKVLVLLGARRVGKTELLKRFITHIEDKKYLLLNGDDQEDIDLMNVRSVSNYRRLLGDVGYLIIDEAQNIPNIGQKLKLIVDSFQGIKVIVTGSSVFDISEKLGEPLVGRKNVIHLFPFAQIEYAK